MNDGHAESTDHHNGHQDHAEHIGKEALISTSVSEAIRGEICAITIGADHSIVFRFAWMVRWHRGDWHEIDPHDHVLHRNSLPAPDHDGRILIQNGEHAFKIFPRGVALDQTTIKRRE
jgi:hypothetical protein